MKLHRNAKTTPPMRQLIIQRVRQQGWTHRAVAEALGIRVRTVAKWLQRARTGDRALADGSSQPTPAPTPGVRGHDGGDRGASSPRRQGMDHQCRAADPAVDGRARAAARRTQSPGAARGAARFSGTNGRTPGTCCTSTSSRWPAFGGSATIHDDRSRTDTGAGYEYAHIAIDDATRVAYVEARRSRRRRVCAALLTTALRWFARRGVVVRRVLTDNGSGYRSRRFAGVCRNWALRHKRTRLYTPRTNGKAESFIQTLLREWAHERPYPTSRAWTLRLTPYLRFYDRRRPQASLGRRTPWTRFQQAA